MLDKLSMFGAVAGIFMVPTALSAQTGRNGPGKKSLPLKMFALSLRTS
jgi:hypothetical protein